MRLSRKPAMHRITAEKLLEIMPSLKRLDPGLLHKTAQLSHLIKLSPGQPLFNQGELCNNYITITKGKISIQKITPDGHEIVLDTLVQGQQCNLATTCLLGGVHYPAEAIAKTDSECLLLPRQQFHEILEQAPEFRRQIFKNIEDGMHNLVNLLQEVAFGHMDRRLAKLLLQHSAEQNPINSTHQTLATELGTAREVISRLLKAFERNEWISLKRGKIIIKQPKALQKLAAADM